MNAPLLIGQRQRQRLTAALTPSLAALAARWREGAGVETLTVTVIEDQTPPRESARYLLRSRERWLACDAPERSWVALAEGWLGCRVENATPLTQHLTRAFCRELFDALMMEQRDDIATDDITIDEWARWPFAPARARLLRFDLNLDGIPLSLLGDSAAWAALLAPAPTAPLPLEPCATALGPTPLRLQATLPAANVPLVDLATLAVGDFLNLGLDLSGRVSLRGIDNALDLTAEVGRREHHKAVRILSDSPEPRS